MILAASLLRRKGKHYQVIYKKKHFTEFAVIPGLYNFSPEQATPLGIIKQAVYEQTKEEKLLHSSLLL